MREIGGEKKKGKKRREKEWEKEFHFSLNMAAAGSFKILPLTC